jgi:hypothetical protein
MNAHVNWSQFLFVGVALYALQKIAFNKPKVRTPWHKNKLPTIARPTTPVPLDTQFVPSTGTFMTVPPTVETFTQSTAQAGQIRENVPFPQRVPVPTTMVPQGQIGGSSSMYAPINTIMTPTASASSGWGYAPADANSQNQSYNGVMSEWTQWGPCNNGKTYQTRTCIHGGLGGLGNDCGHTVQGKDCKKF